MRPERRFVLREELNWESGEVGMEFRLTYEGVLLSANGSRDTRRARKDDKHGIRQRFHTQLKRLFETTPLLRTGTQSGPEIDGYTEIIWPKYDKGAVVQQYQMYGWQFLPLVTPELKLSCWLDILYLRRQGRGPIWEHGDIDNRLKTLFDCLQVPDANQKYEERTPGADETPLYCLLANDRLISKVSVETDMLLEDLPDSSPDENDARLLITVRLRPLEVTFQNMLFG